MSLSHSAVLHYITVVNVVFHMGYECYCCYSKPCNRFVTHVGWERIVEMRSCSDKQLNILLISILKRQSLLRCMF